MARSVFILLLLFTISFSHAQTAREFTTLNDSINRYFSLLQKNKPENTENIYVKKLDSLMAERAKSPDMFYHDFSSVPQIKTAISDDKKVAIISWHIVMKNGAHSYFGYFLAKDKQYSARPLKDILGKQKTNTYHQSASNIQSGSLIYQIVKAKGKGKKGYTIHGSQGPGSMIIKTGIDPFTETEKLDSGNLFATLNDSLNRYFSFLKRTQPDSIKNTYLKKIDSLIGERAKSKDIFFHDFSPVRQIGTTISDDNKVAIISWNALMQTGEYKYYGFLFYSDKEYSWRRLNDVSKKYAHEKPINNQFSDLNWYGALYYDIITVKARGKQYYTLLGWRAKDLYVTEKVIEPLWFKKKEPLFGADIFKYDEWDRKRMIFQYSSKTAMSLKWDPKVKWIIFDHLTPSHNLYGAEASYYGPEGSFDAFRFKGGKWVVEFDIDARNPKKNKSQ